MKVVYVEGDDPRAGGRVEVMACGEDCGEFLFLDSLRLRGF